MPSLGARISLTVLSTSLAPSRKEMELFRVFDSLEFEDNEVDKVESGIQAQGNMDAEQTKALLRLIPI